MPAHTDCSTWNNPYLKAKRAIKRPRVEVDLLDKVVFACHLPSMCIDSQPHTPLPMRRAIPAAQCSREPVLWNGR